MELVAVGWEMVASGILAWRLVDFARGFVLL
jgi:hypothetical protein